MTPDSVKADYRRSLKEWVVVRRFTGIGPNRPRFDVSARARVVGYAPEQLVGVIQQGDRKAIVYADDLIEGGMTLPITTSDKLIVNGREMAIIAPDDLTRRVNGVLIALELQVRG